jgi:hypothetical protein
VDAELLLDRKVWEAARDGVTVSLGCDPHRELAVRRPRVGAAQVEDDRDTPASRVPGGPRR